MTLQSLFHFRHNNFLFLCNKNENYFSSCIRPEVFAKVNRKPHPSKNFFIARNATSKLFNCLVLKTLCSKTKQMTSVLVKLLVLNQCLNGRGFILKKFPGEIQNRDAFKSDSLLNLLHFLLLKEFKQHLKNVSPL